jgi:hypothetical protein
MDDVPREPHGEDNQEGQMKGKQFNKEKHFDNAK